ncbi:hypothetical protein D0T84_10615 [Dysgonomonas sp. 521]|uniref:hypothetical protein n=1 Tax=Dysgonomonas sp. 521 TaxID=2302932 RepID=UPI0013D4F0E9|nr:hypothetical protein [Dysgonomonas sp. 521]NDV95366.1 hypothetical protein [Dysgonomonas sp. 521]
MADTKEPIEFTLSMKNPQNSKAVSKVLSESIKNIIEAFFKTEEEPLTVDGINKLIKEAKDRLKGEQDKKIAEIEKFYKEKKDAVTKAEDNAKTPEEKLSFTNARLRLTLLEANEKRAIEEESNRKILEAEAKLIERKTALSNKFYLFKSDKDRISLEEQKKNAEKQLESLKLSQSINNTPDLATKIEEAELKVKELNKSIGKLSVQKFGEVVTLATQLGGAFKGIDDGFDSAVSAVGNISKGFSKGKVEGITAILSETVKIFTNLSKVNKEHREAERKLKLAKIEQQRQYNKLLFQEMLLFKEGTSIFGTRQIDKAVQSIELYREATADYKDELKGDAPKVPQKSFFTQLPNKALEEYEKQLAAYEKGIGALANVDIVTGSRKSGWGPWKKRKDTYSDILDIYPDLIDGENKLDVALAQSILSTHKMSDENKTLIQSLITLQEEAEKAETQLRDYLKETFGGLGDALTDSIVTAFASGENAATQFKNSVTDILNNLAKQMVFQLYLADAFDKLQSDIEDIYKRHADGSINEEELSKQVTDVLGGFFGGLDASIEGANGFLDRFWSYAEKQDFKRSEASPTPTTGQGLAAITQDSANQLNGSFYNMLRHTSAIAETTTQSLLVQQAMESTLYTIAGHTEHLINIDSTLEDIKIRGVKTRL